MRLAIAGLGGGFAIGGLANIMGGRVTPGSLAAAVAVSAFIFFALKKVFSS